MAIRVLRVRVKDKHSAYLSALAREVNFVWNYCNELSERVWQRERRFMSAYDFGPFIAGAYKEGFVLPMRSIEAIAQQYAKSRRQQRRIRIAWRKSGGARRSLGWVPFKSRTLRYAHGQVSLAGGEWLSVWDSYGLSKYEFRAGSFSEDARGRWFLNVCVEVAERPVALPAEAVLRGEAPSVGIDLGLAALATMSDGTVVEAQRFYRDLEPALAVAQRARKKSRVRAIHAKIANRRHDHLHKLSRKIVSANGAVFVGDVKAAAMARTPMAKSVLDAGWSAFRTMLRYKCADAGIWFAEVSEAFSTQVCSGCGSLGGPRGTKDLGVREWTCVHCGSVNHRDVNAARNILAAGHRRLAAGSPASAG